MNNRYVLWNLNTLDMSSACKLQILDLKSTSMCLPAPHLITSNLNRNKDNRTKYNIIMTIYISSNHISMSFKYWSCMLLPVVSWEILKKSKFKKCERSMFFYFTRSINKLYTHTLLSLHYNPLRVRRVCSHITAANFNCSFVLEMWRHT
jgi:hypothetical protein